MSSSEPLREFNRLQRLRRSPELFAALAEEEGGELAVQKRLRRRFADELVRAAVALAGLRRKAAGKFTHAERMWFSRAGLQQATAEAVARHKAQRFPGGPVWDLCCGIGGDAIGLAGRGPVVAVDRDPAACLMTLWNAEACDVRERLTAVCAEVERLDLPGCYVHVDPDRRTVRSVRLVARRAGRSATTSGRNLRVEDASPGPAFLQRLIRCCAGGAIKVSPASNFGGKFPEAEIELISLHGECKEASVWFGELAEPGLWRATVLPQGETLAGDPLEAPTTVGPLGRYVFDPDPAVVRAGLVDLLVRRLSEDRVSEARLFDRSRASSAQHAALRRLDAAEEYLTGDEPVDSPFVRAFEVLAELPNNDRAIRRFFREKRFGQVEIKCRHIPVAADELRRRLPLTGEEPAVLIIARLAGKARALVCRRLT